MSERDKDKLLGWLSGLLTLAVIWLASSTMANASDLAVMKQRCSFAESRLERIETKVDSLDAKIDSLLRRVPATNP